MSALSRIASRALSALVGAMKRLPKNDAVWAYTITGLDPSPYLTRALFPRVFGWRLMLHRIHREDADRHMHNHPWRKAYSLILIGGYIEHRLTGIGSGTFARSLRVGSINRIRANDYHRISYVNPGTWTLFLASERVQDWGFLVDGVHVPHSAYFQHIGLEYVGVKS